MATDSTELTFVRCPSCRSLVPAVSTRCRMCGATLDAAANEEADKDPRSGRVRQRTMSEPNSPLTSTATQMRGDAPPAAPPAPPAADSTAPDIDDFGPAGDIDDDPLGDYLAAAEDPAPLKPAPAAKEAPPVAPVKAAPPVTTSAAAASVDTEELEAEEPSAAVSSGEAEEKPRVIVESGGRRQFGGSKPGGLSFSRPREESKGAAARPTPPPAPPKAPPVVERAAEERERPAPERQEPSAPPRRPEPRREEPRRDERRAEPREERAPAANRSAPAAAPVPREGVKRSESVAGRLFGWLVSYAEPDGRSIELREGKFFVTGSSLKESDLIIADKSISTPHALVAVDSQTGLRIQDLMSDRGVFIRHGEGGAYQRREEPCTVEHGDWVRFGDVEFLVCLIAHVGVR